MESPTIMLLLLTIGVAQSQRLFGMFGDLKIPIDVELGEDEMIVHVHKPPEAPDTFRATTNLHIFSKQLIVLKNSEDGQCYLQHFYETIGEQKGRIRTALYNNGMLGNVNEERLNIDDLAPLQPRTVRILAGQRIADFCAGLPVFLLDERENYLIKPTDVKRGRRQAVQDELAIDVNVTC